MSNLLAGFNWEPSVLLGLAAMVAGYALVVGPLRRKYGWGEPVSVGQQIAFYLGVAAVIIALVSPLDALAAHSLFSAHMAQHMLMTFIAPPLWLLGTPEWLVKLVVPPGPLRFITRRLTHPIAAFVLFNGTMWGWHVPAAYEAALQNELLHIVEHVLFIGTGVLGWWPVINRLPDVSKRLAQPMQVMYLFAMLLACTALAALITLSRTRLYPFYGNAPLMFGLPPMQDQVLGGLLMWLPGDMILVGSIVVLLKQWLFAAPPAQQGLGTSG